MVFHKFNSVALSLPLGDAENRLSQYVKKEGFSIVLTQTNRYNGEDQRIQKVEGSGTINYYYDVDTVLYTTNELNELTAVNHMGTQDNVICTSRFGEDSSESLYYYNKDIRESTTNLLDSSGNGVVSYQYTDFGETSIHGQEDFYNEICYTGGIYDEGTQLYYLNARYYNPAYALKKGDILRLADGSNASVESVEILHLEEAVWVYNFTVEDNHTYFVGDSGVWVHNARCNTPKTGNKPKNYSPKGAKRRGAFREAKRKNNIPVSEQPKVQPNYDRNGKVRPGRQYKFKNGTTIRDDSKGHTFPDNPTQNRGPHFNDDSKRHFDY